MYTENVLEKTHHRLRETIFLLANVEALYAEAVRGTL
jgi:hypothetical protein